MYDETEIKAAVRERYAGAATQGASCCGPDAAATAVPVPSAADTGGCGCSASGPVVIGGSTESRALGYDASELAELPDGADLGLGCGNPLAMLELREGETVLDLGSGGGIDCFLAAKRVGRRAASSAWT